MASAGGGGVVADGKISRQYEYLVTELESSDSSIASTIREVFESEKPEDHRYNMKQFGSLTGAKFYD